MEKIKNNAFIYPMPMTVVGAVVEGKVNFMAVGWVSRVNATPPLIAVALGLHHYTNKGIHAHQEFSVNIPGVELLEAVDYCGLVSGKKQDKGQIFEVFKGELEFAPMITQCAVTMECKVTQTVQLPTNTLFIGEIVGAYVAESCLTDGKPDVKKINPFTLTMPDNNYWSVGEQVGKAWGSGKNFQP